jgi:hypothetical protein
MPTFVFAYRSPIGFEPSAETVGAWYAWFDGMGDHLVELGKPVSEVAVLGNNDPARTQLGGYSIISADDLEAAVAIAKGCPQLDRDGGVEIGQLTDVHPPTD